MRSCISIRGRVHRSVGRSVHRAVSRSVHPSDGHTRVEFLKKRPNWNKIASGIRKYAIQKAIQRQVRGQFARMHLLSKLCLTCLLSDILWHLMGAPMAPLTPNYIFQKCHRKSHLNLIKACLCISEPAKVDSRIVSTFTLEMELDQCGGGGTEAVPLPPRLYGFSGVLSSWPQTFFLYRRSE